MKREDVQVGTPATVHLFTDTTPAVVVKVNPKSVVIRRVAVVESSRRVTNPGEPFPCVVFDGDTDTPIGPPERYMIREREDGSAFAKNGSIRVTFGESYKLTDYRH